MTETQFLPPCVFIVILDEVLVAKDIAMIIDDLRPGSRVVIARTLAEAADTAPDGRIEAAFVQRDVQHFADSAIGRRVARDGARVVLVGHEPSAAVDGVSVLPFPFAAETVASLLTRACR